MEPKTGEHNKNWLPKRMDQTKNVREFSEYRKEYRKMLVKRENEKKKKCNSNEVGGHSVLFGCF